MKIKELKKLIENLSDNQSVVEMDFDGAHLTLDVEQIIVEGDNLVFIPGDVYQQRTEDE